MLRNFGPLYYCTIVASPPYIDQRGLISSLASLLCGSITVAATSPSLVARGVLYDVRDMCLSVSNIWSAGVVDVQIYVCLSIL